MWGLSFALNIFMLAMICTVQIFKYITARFPEPHPIADNVMNMGDGLGLLSPSSSTNPSFL